MKKILIAFIGVLLCGCIPMIYPDDLLNEVYLISKNQKISNNIDGNLKEDCHTLTDYLRRVSQEKDIKQYLTDSGADCKTIEGLCYFYFVRKPKDSNQKINTFEVSYYDLYSRKFIDIYIGDLEISFHDVPKKSNVFLKTFNTGACRPRSFNSVEEYNQFSIKNEAKYKQHITKVIYAD